MYDFHGIKQRSVPEFAKTSPKRSFAVIENERFGLVFAKTGSIIRAQVETNRKKVCDRNKLWKTHFSKTFSGLLVGSLHIVREVGPGLDRLPFCIN